MYVQYVCVWAPTPNIVFVNEELRQVFVLEVEGMFHYSLKEAFLTKVIKCRSLLNNISELGSLATSVDYWSSDVADMSTDWSSGAYSQQLCLKVELNMH